MVESLVYGLACDTLLSLFITWFGSSVDLATTCKNVWTDFLLTRGMKLELFPFSKKGHRLTEKERR